MTGTDVSYAFLSTVDDLRKRATLTASVYDTIQAAGLMRRLLTDEKPLLHSARRIAPDVPAPVFTCTTSLVLNSGIWLASLLTDPLLDSARRFGVLDQYGNPIHEDSTVARLPLKRFLRYEIAKRGDDSASVLDLIRHYSHRRGGVHYDPDGRDEKRDNALLLDAATEAEISLRAALGSLARITVTALDPLAAKLFTRSSPAAIGGELYEINKSE